MNGFTSFVYDNAGDYITQSPYEFFYLNYKLVITRRRDSRFPMFIGKRIRFIQLNRASKICYHNRR